MTRNKHRRKKHVKQRHGEATQNNINDTDKITCAQAPQPGSQEQLASAESAPPAQDQLANSACKRPEASYHTSGGEGHEVRQRVDGTDAAVSTEIDRLDSLLETVCSSDLRIAQQIVRALRSKVRLLQNLPQGHVCRLQQPSAPAHDS